MGLMRSTRGCGMRMRHHRVGRRPIRAMRIWGWIWHASLRHDCGDKMTIHAMIWRRLLVARVIVWSWRWRVGRLLISRLLGN